MCEAKALKWQTTAWLNVWWNASGPVVHCCGKTLNAVEWLTWAAVTLPDTSTHVSVSHDTGISYWGVAVLCLRRTGWTVLCLTFPPSPLQPLRFKPPARQPVLCVTFVGACTKSKHWEKPDIQMARLIWMIDKQPSPVNQVMLTLIRTLMWVR